LRDSIYGRPLRHFIILTLRIQDSSEDIVAFLHQAQRSVFELRKSDAFWSAFQSFVSMAFSRPLVLHCEDILYDLARQIFEESNLVHGMAFVLVNQVFKLYTT
jgi:hypothetical protein